MTESKVDISDDLKAPVDGNNIDYLKRQLIELIPLNCVRSFSPILSYYEPKPYYTNLNYNHLSHFYDSFSGVFEYDVNADADVDARFHE